MSKTEFQSLLDAARDNFIDQCEALAVFSYGKVGSGDDDDFKPSPDPVKVECWHCGAVYMSGELRYEYRPLMQFAIIENGIKLEPLWWCRDRTCDGAGFGHDIHRTKRRIK